MFLIRFAIWRVLAALLLSSCAVELGDPSLQNRTGAFSRQDSLRVCKQPSTPEGRGFNLQVIEGEDTRRIVSVNRWRGFNVALIAGWQLPAGWQLQIQSQSAITSR
jgi:hypothetical protein